MATDMATDMVLDHVSVRTLRLLLICSGYVPLILLSASSARAQQAGASSSGAGNVPAWLVTPRISVSEMWTDNAALGSSAQGGRNDMVTTIRPGLHVDSNSARLKAYFDYSLNQVMYANNENKNKTVNALNTFGSLEAWQDHFFVDFRGNVSQQNASAFGVLSSSDQSINANSLETSTYGISPYLRGHLLGFANYLVRYDRSTTSTSGSTHFGNDKEVWTLDLSGDTALSSLSWAFDANQQSVEYDTGRHIEADRYYGTLRWEVQPQFRLIATGGSEANNYASLTKETHPTHGFGFDWAPTERTKLSVMRERRFFGNGHSVAFSHRMARTIISYTDTRDVMATSQSGTVGVGTFYDLIYALTASDPRVDPSDTAARTALTNAYFAYTGLSPTAVIPSNFLASQASDVRNQRLSLALSGVRNTVTFMATKIRREALINQTIVLFNDSFHDSTIINQRGFSVNWAHRLTAETSLTALAMRMDTTGGAGHSNLHTTQKSLNVNLSTQLGAKTTASLAVRRTDFESATNPYTENAVTGTLSTRF